MKILVYGSTYITKIVLENLKEHEVVGYIPSIDAPFKVDLPYPVVDESVEHDIKICLQYDRKIENTENTYNFHTGLLPSYGGCDILYHTLENGDKEQGITFCKMDKGYDDGEIISKITYPVCEGDTALDLYKKMCAIFPDFVKSSLKLLPMVETDKIEKKKPSLYFRGKVKDKQLYEQTKQEILQFIRG